MRTANTPAVPRPRIATDGPAAVLLVRVDTGEVVHANALARQLAPGVDLPVAVDVWSDAAALRDADGAVLSRSDHPLSIAARGEPVNGMPVSALRASDATSPREPLVAFGLPLDGSGSMEGHELVVLLPVRDTEAVQEATSQVAAQQAARDRALLATALSFTLADAGQPDNPLTWVNPAFTATTGYSSEEVLGRNCRFLQGPETDPAQVSRLREALEAGEDVTVVLLNYRKDGTAFWNQVTITPVVDHDGSVSHFVGVQADVTERVEADLTRQRALDAERAARAEAEALGRRLQLVARASELLSQTLDVRSALTQLVEVVVPQLADWAVVSTVEDGALSQVAGRHCAGLQDELDRWAALQPAVLTDASTTLSVLRTQQPVLLRDLSVERLGVAVGGDRAQEGRALLDRLGLRSAMVVPLVARRQVVGTLALLSGPSGRLFDQADLDTAADLARRAALALDNSRLYTQAHDTALTLQRSLLPELPQIDGLRLASAYLPSDRAAQVGGDWWDVFALTDDPSRATALAIGDVMGHDISAAAAMGQLRSVLRTCAWLGEDPSTVLSRMDRLVQGFEMAQLATCVYARLDPPDTADGGRRRSARLHWSNAGHLPPLLHAPDGSVTLLDGAVAVPIGVPGDHARERKDVSVPSGSTLLLFTDGLVETRGGDIDDDLATLVRHVARHRSADGPQALVDRVLEARATRADDVAVLAVQVL